MGSVADGFGHRWVLRRWSWFEVGRMVVSLSQVVSCVGIGDFKK
jgi:hypothetical protein